MVAVLAPLTLELAVPGAFLEVALFGLALYRGLHRRFPIFTAYVGLVVAKDVSGWCIQYSVGIESLAYFYTYWVLQGILVIVRGLVVAEIFHKILWPYRGVWIFARLALSLTATLLVIYAAVKSAASAWQLGGAVLAGERGLEFAVVGTLLALLAICRYYGVALDRPTTALALGLTLYSSLIIVNNTVLLKYPGLYIQIWSMMRRISYDAALLMWLWPLLHPLPEPATAPALITSADYQELAPALSGRMRDLNDRLLDIFQR